MATATATTATREGDDTDDFEGGSNDENVSFGDAKSADLQVFVAPCRVTTPIGPRAKVPSNASSRRARPPFLRSTRSRARRSNGEQCSHGKK